MRITIGPTGNLVQGDVLDVSLKPFMEQLQELDPNLYVCWNPIKLRGYGCWEIRRKPEYMVAVDTIEYNGITIKRLDYYELDLINHIMDCGFLNYDQIRKLKEIDTWSMGATKEQGAKNFLNDIDYQEKKNKENSIQAGIKARDYAKKHYRSELQLLKDEIRSGKSLARLIGTKWEKTKELE